MNTPIHEDKAESESLADLAVSTSSAPTAGLTGEAAIGNTTASIEVETPWVKYTPSAQWRTTGEPDPHGSHYDRERATLALGKYTDDELANGAFMNYDRPLPIEDILNPKPGQHMPIVWMTAVKDRIRWLSRALEKEQAEKQALCNSLEILQPAAASLATKSEILLSALQRIVKEDADGNGYLAAIALPAIAKATGGERTSS